MGAATKTTVYSVCESCKDEITMTVEPGQRWDDVEWVHPDYRSTQFFRHLPTPELRFCIDATCPSCGHYEMSYAPAREEFVCSRCKHTTDDRPKD